MECPKCYNELEYNDNSFTHEFGVHVDKFYYCDKCDETFTIDEIEEVY